MDSKEDVVIANESNTSSGCSVVSPHLTNEMVMDYTDVFTTQAYFKSRDDLINWARDVAHEHGMTVVVKRSDLGGTRKKPRLFLGCERSGQYRKLKTKPFQELVDKNAEAQGEVQNGEKIVTTRKRKCRSKKCDCPFLLRGREVSGNEWALEVGCGIHNHPTAQQPEENTVKPKRVVKQEKSQMQYLLTKLKEHGYTYHLKQCKKNEMVKDIFFAHPTSVDLLHAFPRVLLMDCSYKMNKTKLPLLEIVGVTSTGMTFQAGCAYMESERDDENYLWVCGILRSMVEQSNLPNVIVTVGENKLMRAVGIYFPGSSHLLCRWDIGRSIMTDCKKMFRTKEKWEEFYTSWNLLVYADTESKFYELLRMFEEDFAEYPAAFEYVMEQWIQPYKDRFVSAWTNNVMHFNNTTTIRAESHHSILKKQLGSSMGNFEACWDNIHTQLVMSHNAIKASFMANINVIPLRYESNVFKLLRGVVSIDALSKIADEMRRITNGGGINHLVCECILRKTCGLPCAHEIVEFVREDKPIPLDMVDGFWRKLNLEPTMGADDIKRHFVKTLDCVKSVFEWSSESEKLLMLKRLTEVLNDFSK